MLAGIALLGDRAYHKSVLAQDASIVIAPHTRTRDMLEQLHQAGVLPQPWQVALPVLWHGSYRSFKAGEYAFAAGLTPSQVLEKIVRGEVVIHKLTLPEGWMVGQVRAALAAEPLLTGDMPPAVAEGSLFPDTVLFTRGETRAEILTHLQTQMSNALNTLWATRSASVPLKTPQEALILASIVEKETGVPGERSMVAAVYSNRLRKGMKLQADPTVAYGVNPTGPMGRALTSNDLARDTPYNTYLHEGLPPTPICNPGRASLEAALHPADSDALYFVATGNGGHNFSNSMKEHEKNVAHYRAAREEKTPSPVRAPIAKTAKKRK